MRGSTRSGAVFSTGELSVSAILEVYTGTVQASKGRRVSPYTLEVFP
ncbi:MAG: hypothetical protein ACYTHM_10465 [Planctomycetota bacterium]|jgi:hypothetical protein